MKIRDIPCGCRTCGCMCEAHSPRKAEFCGVHAVDSLSREINGWVTLRRRLLQARRSSKSRCILRP